jgi:hypothetical protein
MAERRFFVASLIHALWLGSGVFIIMVAPAVFRAAGDPSTAADVVGAMLARWHYIALAAPLLLLAIEWRRARPFVMAIIFIAVLMAAAQGVIDVRIRQLRQSTSIPISALATSDPLRQRFGILHGASTLLLLGQVIAAGVTIVADNMSSRA